MTGSLTFSFSEEFFLGSLESAGPVFCGRSWRFDFHVLSGFFGVVEVRAERGDARRREKISDCSRGSAMSLAARRSPIAVVE
ncbi:MAG: hypothetical protein OXN86_00165 [Chloroflexota bacterium]|nr:hypothetical protein [Chloroflexota bacterium]